MQQVGDSMLSPLCATRSTLAAEFMVASWITMGCTVHISTRYRFKRVALVMRHLEHWYAGHSVAAGLAHALGLREPQQVQSRKRGCKQFERGELSLMPHADSPSCVLYTHRSKCLTCP
jgi:hypothetical protein